MKENDGKQKISRRTALKYMGLGAAVIPASLYLGGCTKKTDKSQPVPDLTNIPTDKMTYTALSKTGDKISLLGFGTMRYPTVERETPEGIRKFIDEEKAGQLVDYAIAHGINYFDTAWMYHQGESEIVTGKLLKKYPRNSFYLATKLPGSVKSREDAIATYHKQLEKLQVDYFDYYHLHSLSSDVMYERIYKEWGMLDFLLNEKKEGRIRNLGWSFHGDQPLFDKVLAEPVDWDFVMIQMNYFDWKYGRVPAEYMYNRLVERNIPVMIMEPLLGSRLAKVSRAVSEMMQEERSGDTPAQWAFRFVGSHPQVMVVLSGMTLMEHLHENIKTYST
ncbi:MAG: aldo/keto reductase, partial [Petrimonas sp.]|nr:aldo/keto reductase [Petrimonas sp.]